MTALISKTTAAVNNGYGMDNFGKLDFIPLPKASPYGLSPELHPELLISRYGLIYPENIHPEKTMDPPYGYPPTAMHNLRKARTRTAVNTRGGKKICRRRSKIYGGAKDDVVNAANGAANGFLESLKTEGNTLLTGLSNDAKSAILDLAAQAGKSVLDVLKDKDLLTKIKTFFSDKIFKRIKSWMKGKDFNKTQTIKNRLALLKKTNPALYNKYIHKIRDEAFKRWIKEHDMVDELDNYKFDDNYTFDNNVKEEKLPDNDLPSGVFQRY